MSSILQQVDQYLADLLAGWNGWTSLLALALVGFLVYPLFNWVEYDVHPLLLARQANASPVRQPGESAIYRANEVPHGFPLKTGLGVKEPGAPRWTNGKDGNLGDIWRVASGKLKTGSTEEKQELGKIITIYGKEEVTEHKHDEIDQEINIIGRHLQEGGQKRIAVYLPNSIEYLTTIFSSAFYGFIPILLPFNLPHEKILDLLNKTGAEALVAAAGSVPLAELSQRAKSIKKVLWVVERASRHMDWSEIPEGVGGSIDVGVWHQLVQDNQNATSAELPTIEEGSTPRNLITVWTDKTGAEDIVEFSQQNVVAGIGALLVALPSKQRLNPSDLFLPADSFSHTYTLAFTLAALFSRSSVALNSVAGPTVDIALVARSVSPTVLVASAESVAALHKDSQANWTGIFAQISHYLQSRTLNVEGRMPAGSLITRLHAPKRNAMGATPSKLRLLLVSDRAGSGLDPLQSEQLSDLRIFTRARVTYALTAARVFGAVAQTNIFDYRRQETVTGGSHFGVPLSSTEVLLKETDTIKMSNKGRPKGEIVVRGPSVVGGETNIQVIGSFRGDNTLAVL